MSTPCCYIFGAGTYFGTEPLPAPGDLVIAADGGYSFLKGRGITPDLTIGDFDSLGYVPDCAAPVIRLNPVKDDTDTACAVAEGLKRGFTLFRLCGCAGGRTAHTIANIQTLAMLAGRGCRGFLHAGEETMTVLHGNALRFSPASRGYLSVFSLTTESSVVEQGLKYPYDGTLRHDFPLGVSNEFLGAEASVAARTGDVLVIYTAQAEALL